MPCTCAASTWDHSGSDELIARRPDAETPEFDITAMVDLVFLMNLYFLVTFVTVAMGEMALPAADHASALDADTAVVLSLVRSLDGESVTVYLGDGEKGEADQRRRPARAARAGRDRGGRRRRQNGRAAQGRDQSPAGRFVSHLVAASPATTSNCTSPCWSERASNVHAIQVQTVRQDAVRSAEARRAEAEVPQLPRGSHRARRRCRRNRQARDRRDEIVDDRRRAADR